MKAGGPPLACNPPGPDLNERVRTYMNCASSTMTLLTRKCVAKHATSPHPKWGYTNRDTSNACGRVFVVVAADNDKLYVRVTVRIVRMTVRIVRMMNCTWESTLSHRSTASPIGGLASLVDLSATQRRSRKYLRLL